MKMLLGSALTLALVIPSGPANAELLKNLKVTGGVDLQAVSASNVTDFQTHRAENIYGAAGGTYNPGAGAYYSGNDRLGTMTTRIIAGLGWDVLDDVHAKVTLRKNDRSWGSGAGGGGQGAGGSQSLGQNSGGIFADGVLGNTWLQEAYIKVDKLFGHVDTVWGRQFWGEPGDLIAFWGPKNTYGLFVTAIDAVSAQASNDWMNFMGVAGKTAGSAIGATAGADVDVRGVDFAWKMLPVKINTFAWNRVTHGTGVLGTPPSTVPGAAATGLNDNLWVYGLKLRGEAAGGWISATAALNAGTNRVAGTAATAGNSANYDGKGLLLDAGYKMDIADVGGFTPWGTFGWGSGRHDTTSRVNETFTTIAPDFRPGVIYGRFNGAGALTLGSLPFTTVGGVTPARTYDGVAGVSNPGLSNRIIWGGGLKFNCARHQKATLGLSYWDFNYQYATRAGANSPSAVGNRHIGSEFDVQMDWAHSENVMLSGGWATFQPGGFVKESIRGITGGAGIGVNPTTMLFTDLSVRF